MRTRLPQLSLRRVLYSLGLPAATLMACATSSSGSPFTGNNQNGGSGNMLATGGSGTSGSLGTGGQLGGGGQTNSGSTSGSSRAQKCDDAGCHCFNIGSVGFGGQTGSQAGMGGMDSTTAFLDYLNSESGIGISQITTKPDLTDPNFLAQYDVLIFQWMANSIKPVTMNGQSYGYTGDPGLGGGGYWSFSDADLAALKAWVQNGGGVIVLSGYDYCPGNTGCTSTDGELGPTNQVLKALTDIQYTSKDTYGVTQTGNAAFCLGDSQPCTGWVGTTALGANIDAVGAFHGRGISAGKATVDCTDPTFGVCAAHEDVGDGHVYVYTDEWVTYTSQWNPTKQPANYCITDGGADGANGNYPAVEIAYQVPQFWYNAINYAAQHTMCKFNLPNTTPR